MKTYAKHLLLAVVVIAMPGCASWLDAHPKAKATLQVIGQRAFTMAKDVVISAAVDQLDAKKKGDFLHSASEGLRENMLTVVNSDDIAQIIKIWTPEKAHWQELAAQAATIYAQANPQSNIERQAVIEAIARGLQKAAQ